MKIYTRTGDGGNTGSLSGEIYRKNDTVIQCLGLADELQVSLERVRYHMVEIGDENFIKDINKIIEAIYQLMAELSNGKASGLSKTISQGYIDRLERRIDELSLMKKVKNFVYFETIPGIDISEARVRTRKLERRLTALLRHEVIRATIYKYVNRLSDYLFSLSVVIEGITKYRQRGKETNEI
jgi:cob(I)alamin adenosyltransferase